MPEEADPDEFTRTAVELERVARAAVMQGAETVTVDALALERFARQAMRLPVSEMRCAAAEDLLAAARAAHEAEGGPVGSKNAAAAQALGLARKGKKGPKLDRSSLLDAFLDARTDRPAAASTPVRPVTEELLARVADRVGITSADACRQQLRTIEAELQAMLKEPGRPEWQRVELAWKLEMLGDVPTAPIPRK